MSIIRRSSAAKGNLVLRMHPGDSILIGNDIEVTLSQVESMNRLKMVIHAPMTTKVRRKQFEERNKVQDKGSEQA